MQIVLGFRMTTKREKRPVSSGKRSKHDDPEQSKRFLEAAKEAEADESREGADRAFSKVVQATTAGLESAGVGGKLRPRKTKAKREGGAHAGRSGVLGKG
jgi:hypothetical protein